METPERRANLLAEVEREGSVRISEFAGRLGVAHATLRRDVACLADEGLIGRFHGGAHRLESASAGPAGPTVGMVVPSGDGHHRDLLRGATEEIAARGGRLILRIGAEEVPQEVDGLLMCPCVPGAVKVHSLDGAIPVVLLADTDLIVSHVFPDLAGGAQLAVQHLLGLGHTAIGLMLEAGSWKAALLERGYRQSMARAGLRPAAPMEFGQAVGALTAFVVSTEYDAVRLCADLVGRGIRIPQDVALITIGDTIADLAEVPLTSVVVPFREAGAQAVGLLLDREAPPCKISLLPSLRIRESTVQRDPYLRSRSP